MVIYFQSIFQKVGNNTIKYNKILFANNRLSAYKRYAIALIFMPAPTEANTITSPAAIW